jgi:RHS repeat-associated protein
VLLNVPANPASVDGGSTPNYYYDADGRRVQKNANGSVTNYIHDLEGEQIAEFDVSGNWIRGEMFVGHNHVATYYLGATYFNHSDWLGTERARTPSTGGSPCETTASLPFGDGQVAAGSCGAPSNRHYTGKERDAESGLDNFGARFNSSNLGRFMSPDPINIMKQKLSDPEQWNMYSYAVNSPLRFIDPLGLYVCGDVKKCGAFEKARLEALKSKNAADVRAAKAFGALGEKNGVYVSFADNLKGDRGGTVQRHGSGIETDPTSPNGYRATVNVTIQSDQASSQETLVHEGSHVADRQDFVMSFSNDGSTWDHSLNITLRQSEIKAYQQSIQYAQRGNVTLNFGPCGLMDECKFPPSMGPAQRDQRINELLDDPRNHYDHLDHVLFPEFQ